MRFLFLLPVTFLLAACREPVATVPSVRAVRTEVLALSDVTPATTLAGEVRPRYESALAFRVGGKIAERAVDVGDTVHKGDLLLKLDERDLALTQAASAANVAAQAAQCRVQKADLERFRQLAAKGFLSKAELDRQATRYDAAVAELDALRAAARVSRNQTGYAALRADVDGSITAIDAEAGQVVAAGQTVVRLAQAGELEVATQVPESRIGGMKVGQAVSVEAWIEQGATLRGVVREIASSADPATRTFALRITLADAPGSLRPGMTATVHLPAGDDARQLLIPLSALVTQQGQAGVWVFDAVQSVVVFRAVTVAGMQGNALVVKEGLSTGERIVTAGAPLLRAGQAVRLMDASSPR